MFYSLKKHNKSYFKTVSFLNFQSLNSQAAYVAVKNQALASGVD